MLRENDIIDAVFEYLSRNEGYTPFGLWSNCFALHPEKGKLLIYAYGARPGFAGDQPTTESDVSDCVNRAFDEVAGKLQVDGSLASANIALCFPYSDDFYKCVRRVKDALDPSNVWIFLVADDRSVIRL